MNMQNQQLNHRGMACAKPIKDTKRVYEFDLVAFFRSLAQAIYADESNYNGIKMNS